MDCRVHGVAKSRTRLHDFHLGISTQSCHLQKTKQKSVFVSKRKNAVYCCLAFVVLASWARTLFFQLCPTACGVSGKEPTCQCRRHRRQVFNPWVRTIPWRRTWPLTPVFLPGESHGQRAWQEKSIGLQRVRHN